MLAVVAWVSLGPATFAARAASESTGCAGLQAALDQAQSGDTITLTELCTGSDFSLNNGGHDSRSYTLTGAPGAGFDGTGATTSMLHAQNSAGDPTSGMVVSNLVFRNAPAAPARNGGALFFQGEYSVTLDHDTFTNNLVESGGSGGAVDVETGATSADVTLSNDVFSGNQSTGVGGEASGGAANLLMAGSADAVTLSGDTFADNQTAGGGQGGAVEILAFSTSQSLTVSNSTFSNNITNSGGGAFEVFSTVSPIPVTLAGNLFSGNQVNGCGSPCELDGGGVSINNEASGTAPVVQRGNVFSGNSITGGTQDVNGGGEAILGATLDSTGDVFAGNTLQAPASAHVSKGSALGIEGNCTAVNPQHVASGLAVAGNSIAGGGGASAQAAVSVSCMPGLGGSEPNSLALNDATISGNSGGGGTAGIWGEPADHLTIQNSIVAGDSDGAELSGFAGAGGSASATYTDLCSGAAPFSGAGNICAGPALANAMGGDVRETSSSPTIDAGSNALVPNGLSTDVYGAARIQPRISGGTPIVDMGAAELPSLPATPASASSSAGQTASINHAVGRPAASCPAPFGRLAGLSLGALRLGARRSQARSVLRRYVVSSNGFDDFCLARGAGISAGYATSALLRRLPIRERVRERGRVVMLLSANPHYTLRGTRPGMRLASLAPRLHAVRAFRRGGRTWYVMHGRRVNGILVVRAGRIVVIGIAKRLLRPAPRTGRLALVG